VDINSDENFLSFEGNFVPLHRGTGLVGYTIAVFCSCKSTFQLFPCQLFQVKNHEKHCGGLP
jgi:hypothetical protein